MIGLEPTRACFASVAAREADFFYGKIAADPLVAPQFEPYPR